MAILRSISPYLISSKPIKKCRDVVVLKPVRAHLGKLRLRAASGGKTSRQEALRGYLSLLC